MEINTLKDMCVDFSQQNVMGTPVLSPHSLSSVTENQGEQQMQWVQVMNCFTPLFPTKDLKFQVP